MSRVVFGYAVVLLGAVVVAFLGAASEAAQRLLVVPAICALLVAVVAALAVAQDRWPRARQLALRVATTLPLIVAAALAMRAIRVAAVVNEQVRLEAAWAEDVERGRAAEGPAGRDVYLRLRSVPPDSFRGLRDVLWGMAALSVLAFLLLQYDRFRTRP